MKNTNKPGTPPLTNQPKTDDSSNPGNKHPGNRIPNDIEKKGFSKKPIKINTP